jgi:hypothetical protein
VSDYAPHVKWVALNVRDFPAPQWATVVSRCANAGVLTIPWARLAHPPFEGFASAALMFQRMRDAANAWGSGWILPNYENEADSTLPPTEAARALAECGWAGRVGWSTQGWLPNAVDFSPINDDPVLLQIFPEDMRWGSDPAVIKEKTGHCITHARNHGFDHVGLTFQAYRSSYNWFDLSGNHSIFPGDGKTASEWAAWFPPK